MNSDHYLEAGGVIMESLLWFRQDLLVERGNEDRM
jgi:hypothetical protein